MRVLFVSPWFPTPPDNGAKLRIANLLATLCSRHRVTLIAAHDPDVPPPTERNGLLANCEKVVPVPWLPRSVSGVRRVLSFVWPRPEWVFFAPSMEMRAAIDREVRLGNHDVIVTYELSTAGYRTAWAQVPVILEDVELGGYFAGVRAERVTTRIRNRLFIWKARRALRLVMKRVAACTVPSATERDLLARLVSITPPVEVIENCLDAASYEGIEAQPEPGTLIFTGALTFAANQRAVTFFLREIYPSVKRELPGVRFCITGGYGDIALPEAAGDSTIRLTGLVDDVRPLLANSWVSVVPLLTGGGTRFKILEALALGTPVVSTSKGAEGLAAESGVHLLIADSPRDFAAAVVQLCRDHALRARLSEAGRRFVLEHHTWQAVAPRYLALVERVAAGRCTEN